MVDLESRAPSSGTAAATASGQIAEPVPPPLPTAGVNYRELLGPYAAYVLGDALVPYGSAEFLAWMKSCVESAGFVVEISYGGLTANFGSQEAAFRDAMGTCEEAAISSGLVKAPSPPGDEELRAWYEAYMLTYRCLVENGYSPPAPPSLEAYTDSGHRWHPYDGVSEDIDRLEHVCPQDLVVLFEMLASGATP